MKIRVKDGMIETIFYLTKKERIDILEYVKEELKQARRGNVLGMWTLGICAYITMAVEDMNKVGSLHVRDAHKIFPELMKYKPKRADKYIYWWPRTEQGYTRRITVVNKLIKEIRDGD